MDEFKENNGFIMDSWNDDIAFIMQEKWKMWTQIISSCCKNENEKLSHHQMRNFRNKMNWNFLIQYNMY
jgi:hypothetical protein